ncbi:MAG: class I SAM-dependent methyltransferase [Pseudomonadota bacterium]
MFSYGDGEIYYSLVRHFKPKRIIEIGSGSSTQLALAAIKANAEENSADTCALTCVEPYENSWIDDTAATLVRERVEDLDLSLFDQLGAGDFLFIDSSHVIRPHGDVTREFLQILPRLKSGVIVHIHDIFTPRDYPDFWVKQERRLWNEQYLLEAWLSGNPDAEIICALNWLKHNHFNALADACPMLRRNADAEPGSFWMRIS